MHNRYKTKRIPSQHHEIKHVNSPTQRALRLAAVCAVLTGSTVLAHADNTATADSSPKKAEEQTATLQKVTVKAKAEEQPVGSHDISTEVLQRTQAKDIKDIFATDPSVSVSGGGRNAQRIYLRGIEGSNLNINIDGAKQGRSLQQHNGTIGGIDPELLKQVEVQPGPGADRGPGALGGSIKFETVDAQDLLDPGKRFGAKLLTSYSSAAQAIHGGTSVYGLLADGIGLLAHISAENRESYRIGGGGTTPNSSYQSQTGGKDRDYFVKFSILEKAGHSLRLSAEQNTNSGLYIAGSTGSDMGYAPLTATPVYQTITTNRYTLDHRFRPGNPLVDAKINLYYNENQLETRGSNAKNITENAGGDIRNTFKFSLWKTKHSLTLGTDYLHEKLKSQLANGSTVNDTSKNLGVFLQERLTIGALTISVGARFDHYDAGYIKTTFSGNEISPNIGAEYELAKGLMVYTNYGEAVRATGIIPVGWMTSISPSVTFNNGAGLKPETSQQIAGGMRYQTQKMFTEGDRFNAEASVFETRMKNLIEIPTGGGGSMGAPVTKIWNNPNTVTSMGYELRFGYGVGSFDSSVAYSHISLDQNDQLTTVLRRQSAPTGDRVVWDNRWQPISEITLGYTLTAVAPLTEVPAGTAERPGYVLHDLQTEWKPKAVPGLSFALAVRNLFDLRYRDQTSIAATGNNIVYEPGRDIRVSVSYKF